MTRLEKMQNGELAWAYPPDILQNERLYYDVDLSEGEIYLGGYMNISQLKQLRDWLNAVLEEVE